MTNLAGQAPATPSPNLRANGERQTESPSPRVLMREAAEANDVHGLGLRPPQIRKIVKRYLEAGAYGDFRTWFLGYADPTATTAIRNVLRGGGRNG